MTGYSKADFTRLVSCLGLKPAEIETFEHSSISDGTELSDEWLVDLLVRVQNYCGTLDPHDGAFRERGRNPLSDSIQREWVANRQGFVGKCLLDTCL